MIIGNGFARSLTIKTEIPVLSEDVFSNLHRWLRDGLKIPQTTSVTDNSPNDFEDVRRYLEYIFELSLELFQRSRVPAFDAPKIKSISKVADEPQQFSISISFFQIDEIPKELYQVVFINAITYGAWMLSAPINEENLDKFHSKIQENIIVPAIKNIVSAKSTVQILRGVHDAGIPFRHLGIGAYLLGWGSKSVRLDRSISDADSPIGARLSQSKEATATLLKALGLPAPNHRLVQNGKAAIAAAKELVYPVVVKPNDRERGEGITIDIADDKTLVEAVQSAKKLSPNASVLVEKQVKGTCYRVFIAGGKLLYAVKRNPMSICANGIDSIEILLEKELDAQRALPAWSRSEIKPLDDLAIEAINRAGYSINSIPKKGELIPLRRLESTQWGGTDVEVTEIIHPENIRVAVDAAAILGLETAGIDIISEDISKPWFTNGAIINEVNYAPLLGGAEISRGYIAEFIARMVEGDGRVPIKFVTPKQGKEEALRAQDDFIKQGLRCYLTSSAYTLDANKQVLSLALNNLESRVRSLLMRRDLDALVVLEK